MAVVMAAASRESAAAADSRLDAFTDGADATQVAQVGDDLFAFTRLLVAQRPLRRILGDPAAAPDARTALVERILGAQLSPPAREIVDELVAARWSQSLDLVDASEALARRATLVPAEKDGILDEVEDELFRFGRILDREPRLSDLLSDTSTPEAGRVALLDAVLGSKVSAPTAALLRQTVRLPRERHLDLVAEELAELAAELRNRSVAHVRTAVALTPEQEQQLTEKLSTLYARRIALQVELDESLLGGLVVQVGSEVIDGSVAGKLAAARRTLPG